MKPLFTVLLLSLIALAACGGRSGPVNASQHELDQRHCTSNSECSSGLCSNGRCG
jgi:hypothetical protein